MTEKSDETRFVFQNEMIIQNLVEDFYRQLDLQKPVLILCGIDVDAMAATRILMSMFQADLIQYRLKVTTHKLS